MKYSEWIDYQFGRHIVQAVRANAAGKLSIEEAALEIARANGRTRRKLAWLRNHPEAETARDLLNAGDARLTDPYENAP